MIRQPHIPCRFIRCFAAGTIALALVAQAGAQPTFSIDYHGPPKGGVPGCPGGLPITEGDILVVAPFPAGLPGIGPLPMPCILRTAGAGAGIGGFAGLMLPAYPPAVGLPPGAPGMVEVDAISYGDDTPITPMFALGVRWLFSVDEFATGLPGPLAPNVFTEAGPAGPVTNVASDIYMSMLGMPPGPVCALAPFGNTLLYDGNGLGPPAAGFPGLGLVEPTVAAPGVPDPGSNLDAFDADSSHFPGMPGPIATNVYFSLDGALFNAAEAVFGSGSAVANGFPSGAAVLVSVPGFPPAMYIPGPALGLDVLGGPGSDDLDALAYWDNGDLVYTPPMAPYSWIGGGTDMIFFSVRRGSFVIGALSSGPVGCAGIPISPGDILVPGFPTPGIWITAEQLGLAAMRTGAPANDDLDALDVVADCNGNGVPDRLDIGFGGFVDCNGNLTIDTCEIAMGLAPDCNGNGVPDACDISSGFSADINSDGIPDSCWCPADWDGNGFFQPADVGAFISDWFNSLVTGTLVADYDGNTFITPADVAVFVADWFLAVSTGSC